MPRKDLRFNLQQNETAVDGGAGQNAITGAAHSRSIKSSFSEAVPLKPINWEDYEKIRIVGRGAFGTATLYRRKKDDLLVVLKEVNMHDLEGPERILALNEVRFLSVLHHHNIVSCYDSFECDGTLILELEYCDAGSLADYLHQQNKPLPEHDILIIFKQIVAAVEYLHSQRIVHRDLKTANIFLTKEGVVKVGDFNVCKILSTRKINASTMVGTPYYISPEMCEGKAYNEKSDIWALGCILYEMICLKKTFEGTNLPVLLRKIIKGQFVPIAEDYSSDLRNLVHALLAKDPNQRPPATQVMGMTCQAFNNLQYDRTKFFPQQEGQTLDFSTAYALYDSIMSIHYPRSIIYEVKIHEPHISIQRIPLPKEKRIKKIAGSSNHYLALTYDNQVFAWGDTSHGQLGIGEKNGMTRVDKPMLIDALEDKMIKFVCVGEGFSIFLSKNGLVMSCGQASSGCLGYETDTDVHLPRLVDSLLCVDVIDISSGPHHVAIITGDGKAMAWGANPDGRLGIGYSKDIVPEPVRVEIPDDINLRMVYCGENGTMFVDSQGYLWACGSNSCNKLGLNQPLLYATKKFNGRLTPQKLNWNRNRAYSISLGSSHSAILTEEKQIYTFGDNEMAQLGAGNVKQFDKPVTVKIPSASKVQCGSTFTLVATSDHSIYFFGGRHFPPSTSASYIIKSLSEGAQGGRGEARGEEESNESSGGDEEEVSSDAIKTGECNYSLMRMLEKLGPDFPVLQVKDPQLCANSLKDLSVINSRDPKTNHERHIILKPQSIISLYASPIQLQHEETVMISNLFVLPNDKVYLVVDTTIPSSASTASTPSSRIHRIPPKTLTSSNAMKLVSQFNDSNQFAPSTIETDSDSGQPVPTWVLREMEECESPRLPLKVQESNLNHSKGSSVAGLGTSAAPPTTSAASGSVPRLVRSLSLPRVRPGAQQLDPQMVQQLILRKEELESMVQFLEAGLREADEKLKEAEERVQIYEERIENLEQKMHYYKIKTIKRKCKRKRFFISMCGKGSHT